MGTSAIGASTARSLSSAGEMGHEVPPSGQTPGRVKALKPFEIRARGRWAPVSPGLDADHQIVSSGVCLSNCRRAKAVIGTPMVPPALEAEMVYVRSPASVEIDGAFVLLTLVCIGVVSWIGYVSARESLRAASEAQLKGLQRSKTALVQNILKSARNEVLSLSASRATTDAARELLAAYRQLAREPVTEEMQTEVRRFYKDEFVPALTKHSAIDPPEESLLPTTPTGWYLHYHYIATGPKPYGTRRINGSATDRSAYGRPSPGCCSTTGFASRLEQGTSPWWTPRPSSVLQSRTVLRFGTNLVDGPYAASKMSRLVLGLRNSQNVDDYRVADFEAYYPALGEPRAFVGTPVFDGPRMLAIMVLRMPIEPISNALSGNRQWEADGLGKTGEVYLLGPDQTMRTDSRFLIEDRAAFLATLRRSTLTSRAVDTVEMLGTNDPNRASAARGRQRGASRRDGPESDRRLPWRSGLDGVRARGPGLVAVGHRREDGRGRAMAPLGDYAKRVLTWGGRALVARTVMALLLAKVLTRPITALVRRPSGEPGRPRRQVEVIAPTEYRELGDGFQRNGDKSSHESAGAGPPGTENERLLVSLCLLRRGADARRQRGGASVRCDSSTVAYVTSSGSSAVTRLGEEDSMACSATSWPRATRPLSSSALKRSAHRLLVPGRLGVVGGTPDQHCRMLTSLARSCDRQAIQRRARRAHCRRDRHQRRTGHRRPGGPAQVHLRPLRRHREAGKGIESDGQTSILVTRPSTERCVRDMVAFGSATRADVRGHGAGRAVLTSGRGHRMNELLKPHPGAVGIRAGW